MAETRNNDHRSEWPLLGFALVFPAVLTWIYFVVLAGDSETAQQTAYSLGKAIQFALPIVWIGLVQRERLRWPAPNSRGLLVGIAFGLIVVGTMATIYFGWLKPTGMFNDAARQMCEKLSGIGITGPGEYAVMAVLYSLVHSLLEEYYWRWFVFGRLQKHLPLWSAIAISSVAFMAHHVIVLGCYFGWANGWTYFFSAATAVGGAVWAWLYNRTSSIYGPWMSHLLIDAGIFGIGYDLVCIANLQ
jgi:uncharacterized protein